MRLNRLYNTRKKKVVGAVLTAVMVAGVGIAAWSIITASGSSSAGVGQLTAPTISNVTAASQDAFPDSLSLTGSLGMTVNNPNPGTLYLKSFSVRRDNATGGTGSCDWTQAGTTTTPGYKFFYLRVGPGSAFYLGTGSGTSAPPLQPLINVTGLSIAVPTGTGDIEVPNMVGLADNTPSVCQGTQINNIDIVNASFSTAP